MSDGATALAGSAGAAGMVRTADTRLFGRAWPREAESQEDRLAGEWSEMTARLRVPEAVIRRCARMAVLHGTSFQAELLASGVVGERAHFRALASVLGLTYIETVDPQALVLRADDMAAALRGTTAMHIAQMRSPGGGIRYAVAPTNLDLPAMRRLIAASPDFAARLCVTAPAVLRDALLRRARPRLLKEARDSLFTTRPDCSARIVTNGWQGCVLGTLIVGIPVGFVLAPLATGLFLHLMFSAAFFVCAFLRLAVGWTRAPRSLPADRAAPIGRPPVYSVVVALHREAEVVPDLLVSLGKLVWPRSRLEVKLVCEADDRETLDALAAHRLRPWVEIVEVPPAEPRTKPKALAYVLPLLRGEYVALFDAEDRPHPLQLVEAWRRFEETDRDVACVQAPLQIANHAFGVLPMMFRLEYAALFRGILPWLGRQRLVMPLGGTSNHFRRASLIECGGWDPYNVTEDADLGLRLARHGYRCETISLPTREDAPEELGVWIRQRTRWFKGWMQTWLVHMRSPRTLFRDLGGRSFLMVQILFGGMIVSSLSHPFLLAIIAYLLALALASVELTGLRRILLYADVSIILLGYASFLFLGWRSLDAGERRGFWKSALLISPYWMLMSWAAWRAALQIARDPFRWEKTPHRRFRRNTRPIGIGSSAAGPPQPTRSAGETTISGSGVPITSRSRPSYGSAERM